MRTEYLIGLILLLLAGSGIGLYFWLSAPQDGAQLSIPEAPLAHDEASEDQLEYPQTQVIGSSREGREISAHTYGEGKEQVVFVGAIHGGYEWNSALLSFQLMDYLKANPQVVPEGVQVTVIPVLNPDGLYEVVGTAGRFDTSQVPSLEETIPGRFNAAGVDLNRNFACNWQPQAQWRGEVTDAGSEVFSEPEARAMRNFVQMNDPSTVVFFHSAAGAVYGSSCNEGILPETRDVLSAYAQASKYRAIEFFDAYEVTGAAEDWLATLGIPSFSVELTNHQDVEWEKNRRGIEAVINYYASK